MVKGTDLAATGIRLATGKRIDYDDVDCQAFMELIFSNCGHPISYAGSNDMYRNACTWVGTLDEAKKKGYLLPGVALFMHAFDGGEPDKYRSDGIGNCSHVGMYVGENALKDVDKNGKSRVCNVVHSSQSMDRVAGSTLKNAWTHVGLWKNVDFDIVQNGDENMVDVNGKIEPSVMYVNTANGKPVNFRVKADRKANLVARVPEIPNGAVVTVNYATGEWSNINYAGYTGFVKSEFLSAASPETYAPDNEIEAEQGDSVIENTTAASYRVYIDFDSYEEAKIFKKVMRSCKIVSLDE